MPNSSNSYADTTDVIKYRGAVSADALSRLPDILEACSAELRLVAKRQGKDLDEIIEGDDDVALLVCKGVCDASVNYYNSTQSNDPVMTQFSQAAGGYSISGTLASVGGAFYFPKKFLKDIGLSCQKVGTIGVFDYDFSN